MSALRHVLGFITAIPKRTLMAAIRFYQRTFSPDHGWTKFLYPYGCCRFRPTCSEYTHQAIDELGMIRGLLLGSWRILRCHPWSAGGEDPVPPRRSWWRPLVKK